MMKMIRAIIRPEKEVAVAVPRPTTASRRRPSGICWAEASSRGRRPETTSTTSRPSVCSRFMFVVVVSDERVYDYRNEWLPNPQDYRRQQPKAVLDSIHLSPYIRLYRKSGMIE